MGDPMTRTHIQLFLHDVAEVEAAWKSNLRFGRALVPWDRSVDPLPLYDTVRLEISTPVGKVTIDAIVVAPQIDRDNQMRIGLSFEMTSTVRLSLSNLLEEMRNSESVDMPMPKRELSPTEPADTRDPSATEGSPARSPSTLDHIEQVDPGQSAPGPLGAEQPRPGQTGPMHAINSPSSTQIGVLRDESGDVVRQSTDGARSANPSGRSTEDLRVPQESTPPAPAASAPSAPSTSGKGASAKGAARSDNRGPVSSPSGHQTRDESGSRSAPTASDTAPQDDDYSLRRLTRGQAYLPHTLSAQPAVDNDDPTHRTWPAGLPRPEIFARALNGALDTDERNAFLDEVKRFLEGAHGRSPEATLGLPSDPPLALAERTYRNLSSAVGIRHQSATQDMKLLRAVERVFDELNRAYMKLTSRLEVSSSDHRVSPVREAPSRRKDRAGFGSSSDPTS